MKATDILDKFKSIILSEDGEVMMKPQPEEAVAASTKQEAPAEEVELSNEEVAKKEVTEALAEEPVAEEEEVIAEPSEDKDDKYATKEELAKALSEMKAMYESLMSAIDDKESMEVPEEISKQELSEEQNEAVEVQEAEVKEEIKAEEPSKEDVQAEPITHSPENNVEDKPLSLYAQRGAKTTTDSVFNKLFK